MQTLDLQKTRCPMSLVLLKSYLLAQNNNGEYKHPVCLLFSNQAAMQDIMKYLDKKAFSYQIKRHSQPISLVLQAAMHSHL